MSIQQISSVSRRPYWWQGVELLENISHAEAITLPSQADIVIVGAGFTGLSAGLALARAGRRVVICEAGEIGRGAATRNGGMCSGSLRYSHQDLTTQYGSEFADGLYAESQQAREYQAEFISSEGIECDFEMTGRFTAALSPSVFEAMKAEADRLNALYDAGARIIYPHEQHHELASHKRYGGLLRMDIGGYHPGKFFQGLVKRALDAGVQVIPQTPVQTITQLAGGYEVITDRGSLTADRVIVASNAYTGTKRPFGQFLRRRIVPVQSCIIVTEHLGREVVKKLMPTLRMYGDTAHLHAYFRPTPDKARILLGARSFDKTEPSSVSLRFLKNKLCDLFPSLHQTGIEYCWLGNVAFNRQQLPRIFEHEGIYQAAGYSGSGTVWALWLGHQIANRITRNNQASSLLIGKPSAPIPFYDGTPWFMPAINGWFALKDKVNSLR